MAQLMICSSCNKHYDSVHNEKTKTHYKTCNDCRHARKQRVRRIPQQANNEDNIYQQSQAHNNLNHQVETH